MPRPREFDEKAVLDRAVERFRSSGVAGTSIRDLERATGLSNGSIYQGFGGKDGLLAAALNHYASIGAERRAEHFAVSKGLPALEGLFRSLIAAGGHDRDGCLITNVATASPTGATRPEVSAELAALTADFTRELARDMPPDAVAAAATRLLMLYQGLMVLLRAGHPVATCEAAVIAEFQSLRAQARQ